MPHTIKYKTTETHMLDSTRQLITDLETEWGNAIAGHYPGDLPSIWHDLKAAKRMAQVEELAGL